MSIERHALPGLFITFEGCEGAGKSTQVSRAMEWLTGQGIPVLVTREPGGTSLGSGLRSLLLDPDVACIPLSEMFILLADRAQHVAEIIVPALREWRVVLCDRYNDSTLAYQAWGGGLDLESARRCCEIATTGLEPDLTILLDMDPAASLGRLSRSFDRMEQKGLEFHARVRQGFLELARQSAERIRVIDAQADVDTVSEAVQAAIQSAMRERGM